LFRESNPASLVLDGGDFFGAKSPPRERDKSKLVTNIMGMIGYDAVGIGEGELRYGLGFLRAQLEANKIPAVSANLVYIDTGRPIVEPYRVIKRGGLKIGVTAIAPSLEELRDKEPLKDWRDQNVTVTDPKTALSEVVERMRNKEKVDMVVVLSHLGDETARTMVEEVPGITVWIEAHNRGRLVKPEKVGETILTACRGRSSGYSELYLSMDDQKMVSNFVGQAKTLEDKGPADEAAVALIAEFKKGDQKPVRPRAERAEQPRFNAAMVNEDRYSSVESCKKCHMKIYDSWTHTAHASAYATIAETDQWNDPDCLMCHTTGYGTMSDPESGMIEPKYWNVQCESCHGMGTKHSRAAGAEKVPEHVCLECHNQSNSPKFDYQTYLKTGVH
jgi:hypothetical protein